MGIPPYNHEGLLPPFLGDPTGARRSPYRTTSLEIAEHFGTSRERIGILRGFFTLRARLGDLGIVVGFQWLDGSFVERIDETRPPHDIDVVTFFHRPPTLLSTDDWDRAVNNHPDVFDHDVVKGEIHCDTYWVDLSAQTPRSLTMYAIYWFGVFSHKRVTLQWKGMLQLPLGTAWEDAEAVSLLDAKEAALQGQEQEPGA